MRRTALLMLALMAAVLVVASGVAWPKTSSAPKEARRSWAPSSLTISTPWGATTWFWAMLVPTRYAVATTTISSTAVGATTSSNIIYSEGGFRDEVNCGRGTDTAYVDPKDWVVGCERKR
jgi:hypothetical protein